MPRSLSVLLAAVLLTGCISSPDRSVAIVDIVDRKPDERSTLPDGGGELQVRKISVIVRSAARAEEHWTIIIAFSAGRYWWAWEQPEDAFQPAPSAPFPGPRALFAGDSQRLALLIPTHGPGLLMRTVEGRVASLSDAETRVLRAIMAEPLSLRHAPYRAIDLRQQLAGLLGGGDSSPVSVRPTIEAAVYTPGGGWLITLGAAEKRATVAITDDYEVIEAKGIP